ncbi:MAG: hypothetical protein OXH85_04135 [Truepera sp.]|nr:hypothetical protein [Truepera sp.]
MAGGLGREPPDGGCSAGAAAAVFSGENRGGFDGPHLKRCPADRDNAAALQVWWSLAAAAAGVVKAKLSDRVI